MPENNFSENRALDKTPPLSNSTSLSFGEGRGEATLAQEKAPPLFLGEVPEGGRGQLAQDNSLNPEKAEQPPFYYRKCIQDPNDLYTFYYDKITRRTIDSPKYGKPPDGFREVPKKDCLDNSYFSKGFGRYDW